MLTLPIQFIAHYIGGRSAGLITLMLVGHWVADVFVVVIVVFLGAAKVVVCCIVVPCKSYT